MLENQDHQCLCSIFIWRRSAMWDDEVSKFEGRQEWVGESSNVLVSKTQKNPEDLGEHVF